MTAGPDHGGRDAGAPDRPPTDDGPDSVVRWLRGRTPAAPAPMLAVLEARLARHDRAAFAASGAGPIPERLASAGLAALRDVLAGAGDRSSAETLLAADALLTYAVEAAAEGGRDALERLLAALELDRFETLLRARDGDR